MKSVSADDNFLSLFFSPRFPHCDCIQLGYSVHAVAKVRGVLYIVLSYLYLGLDHDKVAI